MRKIVAIGVCVLLLALSVFGAGVKAKKKTRRRATTTAAAAQGAANQMIVFSAVERQQHERERYKGLTVDLQTNAKGDQLALQMQISSILTKMDFVPNARVQQFQWIPAATNTKITGWNAEIVKTTPSPEGVLVLLKVTPRHDGNVGLRTSDYAIETYLYTKNSVRYVNSDRGEPNGGVITFN